MKLYKILIMLAILPCACIGHNTSTIQTPENRLLLKAIEKGNYNFSKEDSTLYTLVEISLINNTNSECNFIGYSCATGANIITNSKHVKICPNQCPMNFPKPIIVKPGQEFSIPVIFQISKYKGLDCDPAPLKIGFVLVPQELFNGDNFGELLFKMITNNENILWCDLSNIGGDPYEIR